MLLRHSLGMENEAQAVERAVESVLADGLRTGDIAWGAKEILGTVEMGAAVVSRLTAIN